MSLLDPGAPGKASTYRVELRRTAPPRRGLVAPSIEMVLAGLSEEDRRDLLSMYRHLPVTERQEYEQEVLRDFHGLGLRPEPDLLRQAVLYRLFAERFGRERRQRYPHLQ